MHSNKKDIIRITPTLLYRKIVEMLLTKIQKQGKQNRIDADKNSENQRSCGKLYNQNS